MPSISTKTPISDAPAKSVNTPAATYIVAPGRTVDGVGPGDAVELDDKDAIRFRTLGFILDVDGSRSVATGGPAVNVEDGVQIVQG